MENFQDWQRVSSSIQLHTDQQLYVRKPLQAGETIWEDWRLELALTQKQTGTGIVPIPNSKTGKIHNSWGMEESTNKGLTSVVGGN